MDTIFTEMRRMAIRDYFPIYTGNDLRSAVKAAVSSLGATEGLLARLTSSTHTEDSKTVDSVVKGMLIGAAPDTITYGTIARGQEAAPSNTSLDKCY